MKHLKLVTLVLLAAITLGACQSTYKPSEHFPKIRKSNVSDRIHGGSVDDPYRWLEDNKSKDVEKWSRTQTDISRMYLSKLSSRWRFKGRLKEILSSKDVGYWSLKIRGKISFAMKSQLPRKVLSLDVI